MSSSKPTNFLNTLTVYLLFILFTLLFTASQGIGQQTSMTSPDPSNYIKKSEKNKQEQNLKVSKQTERKNAISDPIFDASKALADSTETMQVSESGSSPPLACGSGPKIASDIWQEYERQTKEAGCYMSWNSSKERYAACMQEFSKIPGQILEEMIGFWNTMMKNEWATIGPRRVESGTNTGTLVSPGNRLWITSTPEFMDNTSIKIEKRKASQINLGLGMIPLNTKVDVTVCSTDPDGNTKILDQETVLAKDDAGTVLNETFSGPEPGIITINMNSQAVVPLTFKYALEVESEPKKFNAGPVEGFADIHVHQMADEAYGGLWYWGDHDGQLQPDVELQDTDRVESIFKKIINVAENRGKDIKRPSKYYTHAIPDILPPDMNMNIEHGAPAPNSLESWPRYDDIAHQQVNAKWLKKAHDNGLKLMVLSPVNFQAVCKGMRYMLPEQGNNQECGDMENVKRQIRAAHEMDEKYDWYEIAVHPWHARKIINEGKLAVVISMEVSNLLPSGEGDFIAQVEELRSMGLRTMQLAHETNSKFAGAAPHKKLFTHFEGLKHPFDGKWGFNLNNNGKNKMGVTDKGERLINTLIDRHMPIDIAHLSERSTEDVYQIVDDHGYFPIYNSHTRLKRILTEDTKEHQREFLTTCEQAQFIEETGGMVGLRTGDTDLLTHMRKVEDEEERKEEKNKSEPNSEKEKKEKEYEPVIENSCPGSVRSFAQLVQFTEDQTGLDMAFGSDLNGFITQLGPRFGPEACHGAKGPTQTDYAGRQKEKGRASEGYSRLGLSHIGYLPEVLKDLDQVGADTESLENSAEAFLQMWERAWNENRTKKDITTSCWTPDGKPWNDAKVAKRGKSISPSGDREIDNSLELQVEGNRGSTKINDFSLGKTVAGSFLREVTFSSINSFTSLQIQDLHLHKAGWDTMGFMKGKEFIRQYDPDSKIMMKPGRYTLETNFLNSNGQTLTGHTFFRIIPNPDSVRAEVDFTLNGSQDVVSYHWDHEENQYAFTHSRGTQGTSNTGGWHFREFLVPEARSWDEYTVQEFYMEVDGEPISPGDTVRTPGEHTLAIYACHNVIARPCGDADWDRQWSDKEEKKRRYYKDKDKNKNKNKDENNNKNVAPGPLPPGMMLIARQPFTITSSESSTQKAMLLESEKREKTTDKSQDSIGLTLKPKGGFSLPGVSSFGDISGLSASNLQDQTAVFTWGASATLGSRDGFVNIRFTGLHRSASMVTTLQNDQITTTEVDMSFSAASADLVLSPLPRILIQPYALVGYGYRKLSFNGNSSENIDDSWKQTVPLGMGADIPIGNNGTVIGIEMVDYISNFSSEGNRRHDTFILGTIGIPLF